MIDTTTSRPAEAAPLIDEARPMVESERGGACAGELLRWAAAVARTIDRPVDALAIRSSSARFVAAAVLAAWQRGVDPLLLDPNLKTESAAMRRQLPELITVSDRADGDAIEVDEPASEPLEVVWPGDDQTAALFFTSGSTGEPKVIRKLGRQLYQQLQRELPWLGLEPGLEVVSLVPPFHILGFLYGLFVPLLGRGATAFLHSAAPAAWIDHLADRSPQLVVGVPSHYRFLVNSLDGQSLPDCLYLSSGSPLSPAVDEAFSERTGPRLTQIYGSTETGGLARRQGFGPWQAFPDLEWSVRGEDGRLQVRSSWQDTPGRWTVTDDLAAAEEGGFSLRGRADSVVKVGGKRFSTNEIIQQIQGLAGVENAVAVVYERFSENAVALFLTTTGELTEERVRTALGEVLAPFKVPRTIRVLDNLPTLSNGKVDLSRLRAVAQTD